MKKKLLVIALAFAMVLSFAACKGGGGESAAPAEEAAAAAEPNTGVAGIVFTIPEDWTPVSMEVGSYASYEIPGTNYGMSVNGFGDEQLESVNKWGEEKFDSVQAYFDKYYTVQEEDVKEGKLETSTVKVCDVDATYNKYTGGKDGVYEVGTYWMLDNTIYSFYLFDSDNYDNDGGIKDDATPLSDDMIKQYEAIIASIQKGDGKALQKEALAAFGNSLGSMTFEVPAGYTLTQFYDNFVSFEKDGSTISLQFSKTGEDQLQYSTKMDGSTPESLQDMFNDRLYEGIEMTTIAGCDGYINKWPGEDDQYYNVDASFLADDAVYDVYMGSDSYDEEGNLKEGAEALTEDDLAAFDAFIASLAKK